VTESARRESRASAVHPRTRDDPYRWLRERDDPEVRAHLEAENRHAEAVLAPLAPLVETLFAELRARVAEDDSTVPCRRGGWLYAVRTERGREHPVHVRRADESAPEERLLDLNALVEPGGYVALGAFEPSDDGRLLAYTLDRVGFREYTLHVLDTARGELLAEAIPKVTSLGWAADSRTLVYTVENAAKRSWRAYRHRLGEESDELLFEEEDERFALSVARSRSGEYLFLESASLTASEVRLLAAARPEAAPVVVAPRVPEHRYDLDHTGDRFVVRSNATGRNFALFEAPVADPRPASWRPLRAHDPEVAIEAALAFRDHLVVVERARGLARFRIAEHASGAERLVPFAEPSYRAEPGPNFEFAARTFRFEYQSLVAPESTIDVDLDTGATVVRKRKRVPGYDPSLYAAERIEATAPDGVAVPISLVARRDRPEGGAGPALLVGYGAYGVAYDAQFSANAVSLLDRGFLVAIAHVRGGGDLGKPWHDAGRLAAKATSFTDFLACAEELVRRGLTAPSRLAISGGSAGGLLVAAALNARPDLFGAALLRVPFVDVVQTMLDPSLPLTVTEFEEWGNPALPEELERMLSWSPIDNLRPVAYPPVLVRASFWDSQVMYWEPAKYAAKLRATTAGPHPVLLLTLLDGGGHGGKAGRYERLRDTAVDYAFLLAALGVTG
jgi:oligopeptidase B